MSETPTPITLEKRDNGIVIRVVSKMLDEKEFKEVNRLIDEASQGPGVAVVVLDLSRVQLVPSLTLGALVQLSSKCKARQQTLKLASLPPMLRQIFRVTRMDRVLEMADSVDAAML